MSSKKRAQGKDKVTAKQRSPQPEVRNLKPLAQQAHPTTIIQRAGLALRSLTSNDVSHLQRTIGNRAVGRLLGRMARRGPVSAGDQPTQSPLSARGSRRGMQGGRSDFAIQPKLMVGAAGDQYEQEADRVASQVMRWIDGGRNEDVQRLDGEEIRPGTEVQTQADEEELQMKPLLRRSVTGAVPKVGSVAEDTIDAARGSGQALPESVRGDMEQAFGVDFRGVRVHADSEAHALSDSLQARAFTTGKDIFFRRDEYKPGNTDGQRLIAHELAHVIQQQGKRQPEITGTDVGGVGTADAVVQREIPKKLTWKGRGFFWGLFTKTSKALKEIDKALKEWHKVASGDIKGKTDALLTLIEKTNAWLKKGIQKKKRVEAVTNLRGETEKEFGSLISRLKEESELKALLTVLERTSAWLQDKTNEAVERFRDEALKGASSIIGEWGYEDLRAFLRAVKTDDSGWKVTEKKSDEESEFTDLREEGAGMFEYSPPHTKFISKDTKEETKSQFAFSRSAGPCVIVMMRAQDEEGNKAVGAIHRSADPEKKIKDWKEVIEELRAKVVESLDADVSRTEYFVVGGQDDPTQLESQELKQYAKLRAAFAALGVEPTAWSVPITLGDNGTVDAFIGPDTAHVEMTEPAPGGGALFPPLRFTGTEEDEEKLEEMRALRYKYVHQQMTVEEVREYWEKKYGVT